MPRFGPTGKATRPAKIKLPSPGGRPEGALMPLRRQEAIHPPVSAGFGVLVNIKADASPSERGGEKAGGGGTN